MKAIAAIIIAIIIITIPFCLLAMVGHCVGKISSVREFMLLDENVCAGEKFFRYALTGFFAFGLILVLAFFVMFVYGIYVFILG
jgi:hypothetical protein